jgi:hypothetical protein
MKRGCCNAQLVSLLDITEEAFSLGGVCCYRRETGFTPLEITNKPLTQSPNG